LSTWFLDTMMSVVTAAEVRQSGQPGAAGGHRRAGRGSAAQLLAPAALVGPRLGTGTTASCIVPAERLSGTDTRAAARKTQSPDTALQRIGLAMQAQRR
jgi:hypothetical protein